MAAEKGFFKRLLVPTATGIKEALLKRLSLNEIIVTGTVVSLAFLTQYGWKKTGGTWLRKRAVRSYLARGDFEGLEAYLYEVGEARSFADARVLADRWRKQFNAAVTEAKAKEAAPVENTAPKAKKAATKTAAAAS